MAGSPVYAKTSTEARYTRAPRPGRDLHWLGDAADAIERSLQGLASTLSRLVGCEAGLLLMLPIGLMLQPLLALTRSAQDSWWVRCVVLLVLGAGIVAGPLVGTRAGLVLIPIYVLGWTCSLRSLSSAEAAEIARARLARAGRSVRHRFTLLRPLLTPDQRN